jgi:GNAT superfamily N-acetyltransferase
MATHRLRKAARSDARFLGDMLVEAVSWAHARSTTRVDVLADPAISRYVEDWKRPGDSGIVAVDSTGTPIGACWYRLFSADRPGFGYVAPGVPELTLGVVGIWRGEGIGRDLLRSTLSQARQQGHNRLSLSVDRGNFATRLYLAEGFLTVNRGAVADTMVRVLR